MDFALSLASLIVGAAVSLVSVAITEARAAKRAEAGREHDLKIRALESQEARRRAAIEGARTRVQALLTIYLQEIQMRYRIPIDDEGGRDFWGSTMSDHYATALLIPDEDAREDLGTVVHFLHELSDNYHAVSLLGEHTSYGSALYEAVLIGRDVCAEWLRDGFVSDDTRELVADLRARLELSSREDHGPGAASLDEEPF